MSSTPTATKVDTDGRPLERHRWAGSIFVLVAIAMNLMDTTIVVLALPAIERGLRASTAQLQWVSAIYTLTFALTLVTVGRIGDIAGRKRMVLAGIGGFVLASAACSFAPSIEVLLAGRVLQGLTGAFILTQGLSIFQVAFPPSERSTILGLFGAVAGMSAALGPLLGGVLVHADLFDLGWRPIFLVNLPLGVVTFIGAALFVRESRSDRPPTLDLTGVVMLTAAILALLYPLIQGRQLGWPWWTYLTMALAVPLFAVFGHQQNVKHRRGGTPLVQPDLFRQRPFVAGLAVVLVFFAGFTSLFFVFSIYVQEGLGFSALQAGLATMASPVATMATSIASTPLAARLGPRVLTVGSLIVAAGQLMLIGTITTAGAAASVWTFVPAMAVSGIGVGLVIAPVVDIILARVPAAGAGSASGLLNTAEQLGVAVGVAVVGTIFFGQVTAAMRTGATASQAFSTAIGTALWANVGMLVVATLLTLFLPRANSRMSVE